MKLSIILGLTVLLITAITGSYVSWASDEHIATPHGEMEFNEMAPYVDMAGAHGDMKEGAHGTVGKMKADSKTPRHYHSNPYHGVVISGTMIHQFDGQENPPELTAGSYWFVPAEKIHYTICKAGEECVFYIHSEEMFDMTEAEEK
jgi:quercetin dioxygenase-like cupin family protein